MLTVGPTAKAMQRCTAALEGSVVPVPATYAITVHAGAALSRQPDAKADAEATVRDLTTFGADFDAGPLAISGRGFATYGVTPASVFDACALAHIDDGAAGTVDGAPTVSNEDEDWIVNVASADAPASAPVGTDARTAPPSVLQTAAKAPPQWDVFASAEWRASQGAGS